MDTIVLKFGGSSVADNEKLEIVANKIATLYDEGNNIIVVVSAQGKTTDKLLKESYTITNNPSSRELDVLLSTGEQISISKLSMFLQKLGYEAVSLTGWQAGIVTNNTNQNAVIEHINTYRINSELQKGKIVIIAGFQGLNEKQDITTLGRGGSDTTAVCIAAAIGAKKCYIYSDVEGVFTSDPKKVENALKLKNVSYDEMLDISNEGAKVLHNRCIEIGSKFNIPIIAKSTFKDDEGTIVDNKIEDQKVKSLVKNDNLLTIQIEKKNDNLLDIYGKILKCNVMPIEYIDTNNEVRILINSNELNKIEHIIKNDLEQYTVNIIPISRISIIGYGITNDNNILKKVYDEALDLKDYIRKIEVNNGKIRATFNTIISNEILEKLHNILVNKK